MYKVSPNIKEMYVCILKYGWDVVSYNKEDYDELKIIEYYMSNIHESTV